MTSGLSGDPIDPNPPLAQAPTMYANWYANGYGPAYPPPAELPRPGETLAAAVLGLVDAGLLLVVGFVVILAASTFDDADTINSTQRTGLYIGAGLLNVVTAAVLIIGAVLLLARSRNGRPTIVVGALMCLALGGFWLTEENDVGVWLVIFCGPAVVALALTCSGRISSWLAAAPPA